MGNDRKLGGVVDEATMRDGLARAQAAAFAVGREDSGLRIRVFPMAAREYAPIAKGVGDIDIDEYEGDDLVAIGFQVALWCGEGCLWASAWGDSQEEMEAELRLVISALRDFREALAEISDDLMEGRKAEEDPDLDPGLDDLAEGEVTSW